MQGFLQCFAGCFFDDLIVIGSTPCSIPRFAELLETVFKHGQPDAKWLEDWVLTYQQRLCDVPVDLFQSQDGFSEVEYVLREDHQNMLSSR